VTKLPSSTKCDCVLYSVLPLQNNPLVTFRGARIPTHPRI